MQLSTISFTSKNNRLIGLILVFCVALSMAMGASLMNYQPVSAAPAKSQSSTSKPGPAADPDSKCARDGCDLVKKYVNPAINLLSVVFGLIAVISIIVGGIQYSSSEGDPQKISKAKMRIFNTVLAVVAYFFLFAFLQFLIPGGIFNK